MPKYSAKAWNLYFRNSASTKMSKNGVSVFLVIISEKCTLDILYRWSIFAVDKLLIQKIMRRNAFLLTVMMSLLAVITSCAQKKDKKVMEKKGDNKVLVVYFSATGTTENVAKMIASATKGELYKIKPEKEYSAEDLDWTVKTSRCSRENDNPKSRPTIVKDKKNLDAYSVVYLGFPNWWNMAPRIINTFVEAYGLKGKTVIPFMTSGGSGIENSVKILRKDYPDVKWQDGKLLNGVTQKEVNVWVSKNSK